jgi:hypothetical protein
MPIQMDDRNDKGEDMTESDIVGIGGIFHKSAPHFNGVGIKKEAIIPERRRGQ